MVVTCVTESPMSDDYEFVDYSHEELADIDSLSATHFNSPLLQGCPEVRVELEGLVQIHEFALSNDDVPPIQTHRRNRVLSVSDLISPMWYVFIPSPPE